jgi:ribonuclease PH
VAGRQRPRLGHRRVRDAPASTGDRKQRDVTKGRPDGRTVEIQRLIGRSLRGVIDFSALGENTLYLDCDVLTADGGTRCASITGAYVALALACDALRERGVLERTPLTGSVAAVSAGIVGGVPLLDLDYKEDSSAEVDANVVMTGDGGLIEVQATAERTPLSRANLDALLALAGKGIAELQAAQERAVARAARDAGPRHPQRAQGARAGRAAGRLRHRRAARRRRAAARDGRDVRRQRAAQGARRGRGHRRGGLRRRLGIESAALGGAPGVRSARFAGPTRPTPTTWPCSIERAPPGSALAYVCVIALVDPRTGEESLFEGRCTGTMADAPRGTGGFGYDPIFVPDDRDDGRTMAELTPDEKDAISHRGRAARALLATCAREHPRGDEQPAVQGGRRGALGRLELGPDPAQGDRRRHHRLGRAAHRGAALGHRPGGLDRGALLRPRGRRPGRRVAPLRPREDRGHGGGHRGRADPRRQRGHRLRGRTPPDPGHGRAAPGGRHRVLASRSSSTCWSRAGSRGAPGRPARWRWPPTPRT